MVRAGHNRRWVGDGMFEELTGLHWGLIPALLVTPSLAHQGDPIGVWLILLAAIMASYDIWARRIPNALTALTALGGVIYGLSLGLEGVGAALLGGLVGLSMMGLFYILGAVGAGDVKALAALSTFLGPMGAVHLFATTVISGGLMALAVMFIAGRRPRLLGGNGLFSCENRPLQLPYGVAILSGAVWTVILRGTL